MRSFVLVLAALGCTVPAQDAAQPTPVVYTLRVGPVPGELEVTVAVPPGGTGRLELPARAFGDDAAGLGTLEMRDPRGRRPGGEKLPCDVEEPRVLVVRGARGGFSVRYHLEGLGTRPALRGYRSPDSLLLLPADGLCAARGLEQRPCRLRLELPEGWQAACALPRGEDGVFQAPDYAALAASPVMSAPGLLTRDLEGDDRLVLDRLGRESPLVLGGFTERLERATAGVRALLGRTDPGGHLFLLVEGLAGFMGHPATAVVGLPRGSLQGGGRGPWREAVLAFMARWNPASMPPRARARGRLFEEAPCPSLWMSRGTSLWLARKAMLHAGLLGVEEELQGLGERMAELRNHHLAGHVSPRKASRTASELERQDPRAMNHVLQGELLGLLLDVLILDGTQGKRGLEDLVRAGMKRWDPAQGYTPEELQVLCEEVAGRDLGDFFSRHVSGAEVLPYDRVLPLAGLKAVWFPWKVRDPGLRTEQQDGRLIVSENPSASSLFTAGVRPGDELLRVNQVPVRTPQDVQRRISELRPGQKLRLDLRREGKIRSVRLSLQRDIDLEVPVEDVEGRTVLGPIPPGPLQEAGLQEGDVLVKVDQRRITRAADVEEALKRVRGDRSAWTVSREGRRYQVPVRCPTRVTWKGTVELDPEASEAALSVRRALLGGALGR